MKKMKGHMNFQAMNTTIFASVDSSYDENPEKTKAVRKLVRAIIEQSGGDGKQVKKDLVTNYARGKVWWKEERVGTWDETTCKMHLTGAATAYQEAFDTLMSAKTE